MTTVTDATLCNALKKVTEYNIGDDIQKQIIKQTDSSKIHIGKLIKFYQWLDKALVVIDGKEVLCKILHRCGGNIVDFFTPMGSDDFCETLKEPCVIPFAPLDCVIADIKGEKEEWLLLGYYQAQDITFSQPASKGNYKIVRQDPLEEQKFSMRSEATYTQSEVDELLEKLKLEILEELRNEFTS